MVTGRPERIDAEIRYNRIGPQHYAVLVDGVDVGYVFRLARSGWYCDAGWAGFVHRTRAAATRALLAIRGIV